MSAFTDRSVLLCVTGSIAAYKAAELARLLVREGATVTVAMTRAAHEFIGPMTFEAITGRPVFDDVFASAAGPVDRYGPEGEGDDASGRNGNIGHIEVSKRPDFILIAPATADVIGRIANGLGDDVVTTSVLAASAPVVFAPAMNQRMWKNPIVSDNVKRLRQAGYEFLGPATGSLACGEEGIGRMMEPAAILRALPRILGGSGGGAGGGAGVDLAGRKILVALGRTEEPVDPVRTLANRSSGKMGVAIIEAALDAGAQVTAVAGPVTVPLPEGIDVTRVMTTEEMKKAVEEKFGACDALVMVAAVADYRAATEKLHKMESGQKHVSIDLIPTEDILGALKGQRKKQVVVGFALETQAEEQRARQKLSEKGMDMIVVNNPLKEGSEFGGDTNRVTFIHRGGQMQALPLQPKSAVGFEIIKQVEYLLRDPGGAKPPKPLETPAAAPAGHGGGSSGGPSGGRPGGGRPRSRGGRGRRKKSPVKSSSSS